MGGRAAKPVDQLLPSDLLRRCLWLAELDRALKEGLPAPLDQHCQLANVRGDALVIHVDAPAWAARLRYQGPQLIQRMKALPGLSGLRRVRIRVRPQPPAPQPAPRRLSGKGAENLRKAAQAMPPGPLREAFLRLARRHA